MNWKRVLFSALLSAAVIVSFIPVGAFATETPGVETLEVNAQEEGSVSVTGVDSDQLLMQYIDQKVAEQTGSDDGSMMLAAAVNSRRATLGNDTVAGNMYDALAPYIKEVAAGSRAETQIAIPATQIFKNAMFDAESLGVDRLLEEGSENKITPEAYNAFLTELTKSLNDSLSDMLRAMIADMPYELYWFDNENGLNFEFTPLDWFNSHMLVFDGGKQIGIETNESLTITFNLYVSQDYSLGGSADKYGPAKTTKVDTNLTKAAADSARNISTIIDAAKDEPDVHKLVQYKEKICQLVSYHPTAMKDPDFPYGDPWQLIYVFDNDPKTNVVCEGYSKAFQYLCDNTTFADKKVESRLVSGQMNGNTKGNVVAGAHMWNIVYLDDGYNYIVDVTNCDDDEKTSDFPTDVFLTGAESGSVNGGYTYKFGEDGKLTYTYEPAIIRLFSTAELTMATTPYPHDKGDDSDLKDNTMKASGKIVRLKASALKQKNRIVKAKKAITVTRAKGPVSYKLVKVSKKAAARKFSVADKGNITVKKGLKKGTYKLTIAVTAGGDGLHKKKTKKVKVTVKVR